MKSAFKQALAKTFGKQSKSELDIHDGFITPDDILNRSSYSFIYTASGDLFIDHTPGVYHSEWVTRIPKSKEKIIGSSTKHEYSKEEFIKMFGEDHHKHLFGRYNQGFKRDDKFISAVTFWFTPKWPSSNLLKDCLLKLTTILPSSTRIGFSDFDSDEYIEYQLDDIYKKRVIKPYSAAQRASMSTSESKVNDEICKFLMRESINLDDMSDIPGTDRLYFLFGIPEKYNINGYGIPFKEWITPDSVIDEYSHSFVYTTDGKLLIDKLTKRYHSEWEYEHENPPKDTDGNEYDEEKFYSLFNHDKNLLGRFNDSSLSLWYFPRYSSSKLLNQCIYKLSEIQPSDTQVGININGVSYFQFDLGARNENVTKLWKPDARYRAARHTSESKQT